MQNLKENYNIYIVFSSTPLKIGKFIRVITRNKYNHVSITLDPSLKTMYSFSRHYKSIPFYGGFVKEASARYKNKDRLAVIKVCRIPVSYEQYNCLESYLNNMEQNQNLYVYNLFSAMLVPIKKRVFIKDSFTCIEFVVDTLSKIDGNICKDKFYTIKSLEEYYKSNVIYEGEIKLSEGKNIDSSDCFFEEKSIINYFYYTFKNIKELMYRLVFKSSKSPI